MSDLAVLEAVQTLLAESGANAILLVADTSEEGLDVDIWACGPNIVGPEDVEHVLRLTAEKLQ